MQLGPEKGATLPCQVLGPGGGTWGRLLLVGHHLVVDGVSWRILLEDLQSIYGQLELSGIPQSAGATLPLKTTSYRKWAIKLVEYAQSPSLAAQLPYWRQVVSGPAATPGHAMSGHSMPLDYADGLAGNLESSARNVTVSLDRAETQISYKRCPQPTTPRSTMSFLPRWPKPFGAGQDEREVLVALEGHGREDLFPGHRSIANCRMVYLLYPCVWPYPAAQILVICSKGSRSSCAGCRKGGWLRAAALPAQRCCRPRKPTHGKCSDQF